MLNGSPTPALPGSLLPGTLVKLWDSLLAIVVCDRGAWIEVQGLNERHTCEYQRSQVTAVEAIEATAVEVSDYAAGINEPINARTSAVSS